jgi:hypothetical protein
MLATAPLCFLFCKGSATTILSEFPDQQDMAAAVSSRLWIIGADRRQVPRAAIGGLTRRLRTNPQQYRKQS